MELIVNGENLLVDGKLNKKEILVNDVMCTLQQDSKYDYIIIFVDDTKITNKFFTEINKLMKSNDYAFRYLKKNDFIFIMFYDCIKFPAQYAKCSCGRVVERIQFKQHESQYEGDHKLINNDKEVKS